MEIQDLFFIGSIISKATLKNLASIFAGQSFSTCARSCEDVFSIECALTQQPGLFYSSATPRISGEHHNLCYRIFKNWKAQQCHTPWNCEGGGSAHVEGGDRGLTGPWSTASPAKEKGDRGAREWETHFKVLISARKMSTGGPDRVPGPPPC